MRYLKNLYNEEDVVTFNNEKKEGFFNSNDKFMTQKDIIEQVLQNDFHARNNDQWLILQVLRKMGFRIFIDFKQLKDIPSFETITRFRRKIQNGEGRYLPTDPEVLKKRDISEKNMKKVFSNRFDDLNGITTFNTPQINHPF